MPPSILPSLLGTYFGNPYKYGAIQNSDKNVFVTLETILWNLALTPALRSYARARPQEMVGYIHVHCQRMLDQAKVKEMWVSLRPTELLKNTLFLIATSNSGRIEQIVVFCPLWFPTLKALIDHFKTVNSEGNMRRLFHGSALAATQATILCIDKLEDWMGPEDMATFELCLTLLRTSLLSVGTVVDQPDSTWCTPEAGYICELYPRRLYIGAKCERPAPRLELAECARVSLFPFLPSSLSPLFRR